MVGKRRSEGDNPEGKKAKVTPEEKKQVTLVTGKRKCELMPEDKKKAALVAGKRKCEDCETDQVKRRRQEGKEEVGQDGDEFSGQEKPTDGQELGMRSEVSVQEKVGLKKRTFGDIHLEKLPRIRIKNSTCSKFNEKKLEVQKKADEDAGEMGLETDEDRKNGLPEKDAIGEKASQTLNQLGVFHKYGLSPAPSMETVPGKDHGPELKITPERETSDSSDDEELIALFNNMSFSGEKRVDTFKDLRVNSKEDSASPEKVTGAKEPEDNMFTDGEGSDDSDDEEIVAMFRNLNF